MNTLIEGLERARRQSLQFAQELSDEQLHSKISEDGWTVGQILQHIALVEKVTTANIAKGLESNEPFEERAVDLETVILDRTRKIKAPERLEPGPQIPREELMSLLNSSHDALMSVLSACLDPNEVRRKAGYREHPVFGRLSVYQFVMAASLHELRHLEQIKEILASTAMA